MSASDQTRHGRPEAPVRALPLFTKSDGLGSTWGPSLWANDGRTKARIVMPTEPPLRRAYSSLKKRQLRDATFEAR